MISLTLLYFTLLYFTLGALALALWILAMYFWGNCFFLQRSQWRIVHSHLALWLLKELTGIRPIPCISPVYPDWHTEKNSVAYVLVAQEGLLPTWLPRNFVLLNLLIHKVYGHVHMKYTQHSKNWHIGRIYFWNVPLVDQKF